MRNRRMYSSFSNSTARFLFFLLTFLTYDIVFRAYTVAPYFFDGLLPSLIFCIIASVFVHVITKSMPVKAGNIVGGILLSVVMILYISQMVYYTIFFTFYSVFSAANGGQVFEFWREALTGIKKCLPFIFLFLIPIVLYIIFCRNYFPKRYPKRGRYAKLAAALVMEVLALAIIIPCVRDSSSNYSKFFGQDDFYTSVHTVGLIKSMEIDFMKTFIPSAETLDALNNVPVNPPLVTDPNIPGPSSDPSTDPVTDPVEDPVDDPSTPVDDPIEYGYNVMDIDFDSLIASTTDKSVLQLHNYFSAQQPTQQNEYTGIYEGYNLIFLTAEGFHRAAVQKDITPTLYKLVHEGYYFSDFYTPSWPVSTSDGEYVACTGLIPKSGVWSFYRSSDNKMQFCMGNQLGKLGYSTLAYHNHTYKYYHRDLSHPNMGYTYIGVGNGLEERLSRLRWPNSDLEMMQGTVDDYINEEPFHAYYMTVSGHLEYNFPGNSMASKNKSLVKDLPYSEPCLAYLACQIELDRALEYLLGRLEEAGVAERTLIVLSGDHYPYGLDLDTANHDYIAELIGSPIQNDFDLYKTNLIMYVPGMEPKEITKPCCSMDILPTISNLLGIEYDSRLLMGSDIFSNSSPLVIFQNRSYVTEYGRYDYKTRTFMPNEGVTVPDGYAKSISAIVDAKFAASKLILELDYYRILFGDD